MSATDGLSVGPGGKGPRAWQGPRAGAIIFAAAAVFLFVYALQQTTAMSPRARMFPFAVAIPGVAFGLLQLVRELRAPARPVPADAVLTRGAIIWFAAFFAAVWTLGLVPALGIFTLAYLRLVADLDWTRAALLAAVAAAATYVVFVRLLHIPVPTGVIPIPI